ncbi:MAG: methyltransferase domain-containing protein [Candidatus Yonathbacteria bacterium]|nr:methyltransferase domain-containing protein [Candidatus Yonathbacteria bacterium]
MKKIEDTLDFQGKQLKIVDRMIAFLLKKRMDIAIRIARIKMSEGTPFIRLEVEGQRIEEVRRLAGEIGLNPHYLTTVLYTNIGESCKAQLMCLQNPDMFSPLEEDEEVRYAQLKKNLLTLTERWAATYNRSYDEGHFATRAYVAWETQAIRAHAGGMFLPQGVLVDLGCATGRMSFVLSDAGYFTAAYGYDISPGMVRHAKEVAGGCAYPVEFSVHDFESDGIPLPDESASFVVMNLGTGSDVKSFSLVLEEIRRVLMPGGRFAVSFYNRDALLYRCGFMPWPTGLTAEFNTVTDTLDVQSGGKTLTIYAHPYRVSEATALFGDGLSVSDVSTFPSVSAILPTDVIEGKEGAEEAMTEVDRILASTGMGAYILVLGEKKN